MTTAFTATVNFTARGRRLSLAWLSLVGAALLLLPTAGAADLETHAALQAVKADGTSAWTGTLPFTLRGIVLNNPEELLDSTPRFVPWNDGAGSGQMGGQWQIFVQASAPGDAGGTACWMGQNYGNLGWIRNSDKSYADAEWLAGVNRLNRDPLNNHRFRKGDLVEITANRSLFFGGKRNINEAHDKDPAADFSITLVRADAGLPAPEVITLADLVRPDDGDPNTHEDIFDPTRQTGGERYQGVRVRINQLTLTDAAGWGKTEWAERVCRVTDGAGRFFRVRTSLGAWGAPPTGQFDAIGILNQESGSGASGTYGYELFVQEIELHDPPALRISVVSWPASFAGFQLQFQDALGDSSWMPMAMEPVLEEGWWVVRDPLVPDGNRFYRLLRGQ
jgi:hypothetical protein